MKPLRCAIGMIPTYLIAGLVFFAPAVVAAQEQLSDPGFDPAVANPAYRLGSGPRVLFDEAHFNFHTAGGRYKAFADLLTRDGYRVSPSRERFSPPVLRSHDLLIIANALGAPNANAPAAAAPAFLEDEAKSVSEWVREGGALNLEFTRANGRLKTHAITEGRDSTERVQRVVAFGGQSLQGSPNSACFLETCDLEVSKCRSLPCRRRR